MLLTYLNKVYQESSSSVTVYLAFHTNVLQVTCVYSSPSDRLSLDPSDRKGLIAGEKSL